MLTAIIYLITVFVVMFVIGLFIPEKPSITMTPERWEQLNPGQPYTSDH